MIPRNGPQGMGTTLLRKHKILPHPREVRFPEVYTLPRTTKPRALVIDTGNTSISSSDTTSPRTLKHASKRIGAPGLPPTPPTHSRQSSGSTLRSPRHLNSMLILSRRQMISHPRLAHHQIKKVHPLQMSLLQELCRWPFVHQVVIDILPPEPTPSKLLERTQSPKTKTRFQNQR